MKTKDYLKELSIVILGILIAFGLSNLGAKYQEYKTHQKVLLTILNEVKENNSNIKETIESLNSLHADFSGARKNDFFSDNISISYIGLSFRSVGYETAKYRGVLADLDFELTSSIVENYEYQFSMEDSEKIIVEELFKLIRNKDAKTNEMEYILLHVSLLRDNLIKFNIRQEQLIEKLSAFLD